MAIDGKALRRAIDKGQSPKVIVSAWTVGSRPVLSQRKVEDKSNEITAVPELLRSLELAGCIVTLDAMGCQKQIAREIIESDADYVLALKGNQSTAHEEIRAFLDDAIARKDPALDFWERKGARTPGNPSLLPQQPHSGDPVLCQSRARLKHARENLATLRRWSLNLLKVDKLFAKCSLKARRKNSGWDNACLLHLLGINLDA